MNDPGARAQGLDPDIARAFGTMLTYEKSVIEFLTRNPDFLVRHPDLLRHLSVPHGFNGKTVSLLEYQTRLVRERLGKLEQQYELECLKTTAHRHLSQSLKTLVPMLYECSESTQLLGILEKVLQEYYSATSIRIYATDVSAKDSRAASKILRPLDPFRRGLFVLILNNSKPLCDSLQHEHLAALFGEEADTIHSSLLLPFRYRNKEALLALGSTGWHKYKQSVELDILTTVVEILSRRSQSFAGS
ncbi:MAG: DUF484 family protein [Gammaproteobacteria bacterium]